MTTVQLHPLGDPIASYLVILFQVVAKLALHVTMGTQWLDDVPA